MTKNWHLNCIRNSMELITSMQVTPITNIINTFRNKVHTKIMEMGIHPMMIAIVKTAITLNIMDIVKMICDLIYEMLILINLLYLDTKNYEIFIFDNYLLKHNFLIVLNFYNILIIFIYFKNSFTFTMG